MRRNSILILVMIITLFIVGGCSSTYYGAMEKVGIHKRDILVDRVEDARDSQEDAQEHNPGAESPHRAGRGEESEARHDDFITRTNVQRH